MCPWLPCGGVRREYSTVPFGIDEDEYRPVRLRVAAATGLVLGAVLWIGLVVGDRPDAEPRVGAAWWIMPAVALLLGVTFGSGYGSTSALIFGLTQFVLWFPLGPEGDNDGLQLFWVPTLLIAALIYSGLAEVGGRLRHRVTAEGA